MVVVVFFCYNDEMNNKAKRAFNREHHILKHMIKYKEQFWRFII
jgi:hypothetical protein